MFNQTLKNYIQNYRSHPFQQHKASFGVIFYEQDSVVEKELNHIIEVYEQEYIKVVNFFEEYANSETIHIYIYDSFEQKENLMGNDWIAQTLYNQREIHHVYTEDIKPIGAHELTHLVSLNLGLSVPLFQEGIAEYLQGSDWYGRPHNETLKECTHTFTMHEFLALDSWLAIPEELTLYSYCFVAQYMKEYLLTHTKEQFFETYRKLSREKTLEENRAILTGKIYDK